MADKAWAQKWSGSKLNALVEMTGSPPIRVPPLVTLLPDQEMVESRGRLRAVRQRGVPASAAGAFAGPGQAGRPPQMVGPGRVAASEPPGPAGAGPLRAWARPRPGSRAARSSPRRSRPARGRTGSPAAVASAQESPEPGAAYRSSAARAARRVASWLLGRSSPVNWVS